MVAFFSELHYMNLSHCAMCLRSDVFFMVERQDDVQVGSWLDVHIVDLVWTSNRCSEKVMDRWTWYIRRLSDVQCLVEYAKCKFSHILVLYFNLYFKIPLIKNAFLSRTILLFVTCPLFLQLTFWGKDICLYTD